MTLYRVTTPRGNTTSTGLTLAEAIALAEALGDGATVQSMPGCLILERGIGEVIVIGDDIRITVVRIKRTLVQLRIEAPRDIPIKRMELMPKHE